MLQRQSNHNSTRQPGLARSHRKLKDDGFAGTKQYLRTPAVTVKRGLKHSQAKHYQSHPSRLSYPEQSKVSSAVSLSHCKQQLRAEDQMVLQALFTRLADAERDFDTLSEHEYVVLQRYPHLHPARLASAEMIKAIDFLTSDDVLKRVSNDDGLFQFVNSTSGLRAFNALFDTQINCGDGHKRISAVMPGKREGTIVFELEVTPEGKAAYKAPMTVGRDHVGQTVLQLPVGEISSQLAGYQLLNRLAKTRVFQHRVKQLMEKLDQYQDKKGR